MFYDRVSKSMVVMVVLTTIMCCVSCNNSKSREQNEKQSQELLRKSKEVEAQVEGAKLAKEAEEKELIVIEEERRKNNRNEELLQWLQGTWSWSGRIHVYGSQYTNVSCKLVIDGDYATLYGNDGISSQGRISNIDFQDGVFHFGDYSTCQFDYENRILYYDRDNGLCFKKNSQPSSLHSSYGSSNSSSSNNGSASRLMRKFNSLNEEGRRLTDEVGSYYRTGQASPYTIQAVYRLKQIQDEKIDLARQMGDRDLEALCRQQKAQTLTALRQMGF